MMQFASLHARYLWLGRRVGDLARLARALARPDIGIWAGVRRFWRLVRRESFSPNEIFLLGLLDGRAERESGAFVSKERLTELQCRINPPDHRSAGEDKLAFFLRCAANSLPTPEVLAVSGRARPDGACFARIDDVAQWQRYFERSAPAAFVLKPVDGSHGTGVLPLRREGSRFVAPDGAAYTAAGLLEHMRHSPHSGWLVQHRLWPHRTLVDLSGTDAMQTIRVVTCADRRGPARVLVAWLRINGGRTVFDNFNFGAAGNLVGAIDLATGGLKYVLQAAPGGLGLGTVDRHPVTGAEFSRFALPGFSEMSSLMARAADAFRPLGTLGWDVAVTEEGPSLIEANWTWDPLPLLESWAPIVQALERAGG
jgi:hypothetical protein